MASNPTYDPSVYVTGSAEDFRASRTPPSHCPLNDRATEGLYAPGSTFKLVTSLAAMTKGLITPTRRSTTGARIRIGNIVFRNAGRGARTAASNLPKALTVSSDVFYY